MKKRRKKVWQWLRISCQCFVGNALSVLLVPFTVIENSSAMTYMGYVLGALFWTFLLFGILCFWLCWNIVHQSNIYQEWKQKKVPGILGFFRTKVARVIDPLWLIVLAVSIWGNISAAIPQVVTLLAMSLTLFTFYLHMICNGRVYRYMTLNNNERKDKESEEREN